MAATMLVEDGILQRFLARIRPGRTSWTGIRRACFPEEAELGLFGELVFVDSMIAAGMPARDVLDAWIGPLDGLQDFLPGTRRDGG